MVRQFLRKGVEVTEEVLAENRELRAQLERVGDENTRLRAQIASDDAIRDLFKRIDLLEGERDKLLRRSGELEEKRTEHASRASEVEEELHDLANLYVASSHLHSTLSVRGVVRHVMELLQQLLGARAYALYATSDGRTAHPVAWEQMEPPPAVTVGEGAIGEAMATGLSLVRDDVRRPGTLERPLAVLPLAVKEEVVGAIVILSTLEQKERWAAVDRELFTLLGTHAAISLVASCLFAGQSGASGGAGGARRALMDLQTHLDEQRGARPSTAPSDDRTRSGEREPRG